LGQSFQSVCMMDPMTGGMGEAAVDEQGKTRRIRIQLEVGESCILRTFNERVPTVAAWHYRELETAYTLEGVWDVEFLEGGPELPPGYQTSVLSSWAGSSDSAARFAGTAVYRMRFDRPGSPSRWVLDLGIVHASARIRLNGKMLETLIGPVFQVVIEGLEAKDNLIEIEVTNLAANRIRDMDQRGVSWRIFEDINFVNRQYGAFDASDWSLMDSGLMGPVRLYPQL
jgi:hypothetical protein